MIYFLTELRDLAKPQTPSPAGAGRRAAIALLLCAGVVCGCSSIFGKKPPPPTTLAVTIDAAKVINVGTMGRPSPVVLRVYLLKTTTAFEAADFLSLFEHERETLGEDLVERQELVVKPGDSQALAVKTLTAETHAIGVVAAFQNVERAKWRAVVLLRPNAANKVAIRIDGVAVTATNAP